jgi:hypothetical protein
MAITIHVNLVSLPIKETSHETMNRFDLINLMIEFLKEYRNKFELIVK